jgi:hypothetical protein
LQKVPTPCSTTKETFPTSCIDNTGREAHWQLVGKSETTMNALWNHQISQLGMVLKFWQSKRD